MKRETEKITDQERELLRKYNTLNSSGQIELKRYLDYLYQRPEYHEPIQIRRVK